MACSFGRIPYVMVFCTLLHGLTVNAFVMDPVVPIAQASASPLFASAIPSSNSQFSSSSVVPSPTKTRSSVQDIKVEWDWKHVAESAFEEDQRPIVLFDGKCNLCNGSVNFALDHDSSATFRFASLQSKVGQSLLIQSGRQPDDTSSIVVCLEDGTFLAESDAVVKIAQGLDGPVFPAFGWLGENLCPKVIRDAVYHVVGDNRFRFGEAYDSCRIDFDGEFDGRFVEDP